MELELPFRGATGNQLAKGGADRALICGLVQRDVTVRILGDHSLG